MSDFLLDFRKEEIRRHGIQKAASLMRFCEDTQSEFVERRAFTLLLTRVDEPALWGPCASGSGGGEMLVALAGRVAFDEHEWESARREEGTGGLACKIILRRYRDGGIDALHSLNGNFVVMVFDEKAATFHIVTDRCGMFLAYGPVGSETPQIYGSHPDVLASVLGQEQRLDLTSLAEFLTTGRLTFPATYYRGIEGIEPGCIHTLSLSNGVAADYRRRRYFRFECKIEERATDSELAEELAQGFRNAIRRRTLPIFGINGIGLSGGLDSRVILSATKDRKQVRAFNLFDQENEETCVARKLARAGGVEMIPIQRDFDYYAKSAELGVRISGGTGNIASNHFLGIRTRLLGLGIQNLLTGCYCDYLLKGLALNTVEQKLTRHERLAPFDFAFYHSCYWDGTTQREAVQERLRTLFPEASRDRLSEEDWFNIQCKRSFPLAYEGDLAQRVIPQRIMPWYLPIVDNDILATYVKIPLRCKLNAALFEKMVLVLCEKKLSHIPDSNTGARVGASGPLYSFHRYLSALQNRISERFLPHMATRGSWPNWEYYISHSGTVQSLWTRRNDAARELFVQLLGHDPLNKPAQAYRGRQVEFFMRLFTLKLWLDERANVPSASCEPAALEKPEPQQCACAN